MAISLRLTPRSRAFSNTRIPGRAFRLILSQDAKNCKDDGQLEEDRGEELTNGLGKREARD